MAAPLFTKLAVDFYRRWLLHCHEFWLPHSEIPTWWNAWWRGLNDDNAVIRGPLCASLLLYMLLILNEHNLEFGRMLIRLKSSNICIACVKLNMCNSEVKVKRLKQTEDCETIQIDCINGLPLHTLVRKPILQQNGQVLKCDSVQNIDHSRKHICPKRSLLTGATKSGYTN
jgi:hypothetical protein